MSVSPQLLSDCWQQTLLLPRLFYLHVHASSCSVRMACGCCLQLGRMEGRRYPIWVSAVICSHLVSQQQNLLRNEQYTCKYCLDEDFHRKEGARNLDIVLVPVHMRPGQKHPMTSKDHDILGRQVMRPFAWAQNLS